MHPLVRRSLFCFFFVSGFSSLVYQVVWTRLAFASFGIIAPVLSIVLSVFMLGLTVGSWGAGRWIAPLVKRTGLSAIFFYGVCEFLIGLGAFAVPALFAQSERVLSGAGEMNSFSYLLSSAVALAISIFPWCVFMGATFPCMMAFVQEKDPRQTDSFSFLYVANVLGAMSGTILTAVVLIEELGFRHTLWVAAGGNFLIAMASAAFGAARGKPSAISTPPQSTGALPTAPPAATRVPDRSIQLVLFSTGFISMALEVVWSRGFAGVLKTQVYSFALIIFTYLAATFAGSIIYRRNVVRRRAISRRAIFFWLALSTMLPVFIDDPSVTVQHFSDASINFPSAVLLLGSIIPFCALLGYLTPSLIDEYSAGQPRLAGTAYAINVVGCILGPLAACYLLLPFISTRYSQILLGFPLIVFWIAAPVEKRFIARRLIGSLLVTASLAYALLGARDFEEWMGASAARSVTRRDYIASVVAIDHPPGGKRLIVNGTGMTSLTPITKCIAHVPLALHQGPTQSMLVICFGMGTTFRSALCWGVDTTVVELVPSVPKDFGFYHADAEKYLGNPRGHIVIDDGRRYLSRCGRSFDVITVDPPPPVEQAGCSLLYSTDFYKLAMKHLNPGGILQMWYMGSAESTDRAIFRSMHSTFPYMRVFGSVEGWGYHLVGSMQPIIVPGIDRLMAKMPPAAQADLVEWSPDHTARYMMNEIFTTELNPAELLDPDPNVQVTDDRPFNEYYLLRAMRSAARP